MLKLVRVALMLLLFGTAAYLIIFVESTSLGENGYDAMWPSFNPGNRLFFRTNPSADTLKRYDVVFFRPEEREEIRLFGRIIGLPGETISALKGVVYINSEPLNEPYLPGCANMKEEEWKQMQLLMSKFQLPEFLVPEGYYFILVDNRFIYQVFDSRKYGAVPVGNITGKLLVKF